jgi:hypothetical protein
MGTNSIIYITERLSLEKVNNEPYDRVIILTIPSLCWMLGGCVGRNVDKGEQR